MPKTIEKNIAFTFKEQRLPNIGQVFLVIIQDFPISLYKVNKNFRP